MLSFEEFFHKKKIDLTALQASEPALYAEFSKHYAAMGEKSFDHTKKFWFNKLRKTYLISAGEPAPIPEKMLATSDVPVQPVSEVEPVALPNTIAKPAGFKPRFKAAATKTVSPDQTKPAETISAENTAEPTSAATKPTTEESAAPISKPAGFKPRFKAGATKTVSTEQAKPEETISAENTAEPTSATEEKPATEESAAPISKPTGFKPRFKAGVTKPSKPKDDQ